MGTKGKEAMLKAMPNTGSTDMQTKLKMQKESKWS
jgi:hypothetical protein